MQLIYRRDVIRNVRKMWADQYAHYDENHKFPAFGDNRGFTVKAIRDALARLDLENCDPQDVNEAIGTTGWADCRCDECDENYEVLVRIGQEPDYDARWQDLCGHCLSRAIAMLADKDS